MWMAYMYGPGKSFMALKQRHVSSTRTGPLIFIQNVSILPPTTTSQCNGTYSFSSSSRFVSGDFLDCALDLDQVDVLVPQLDYALEDGLDFGEFVLVACDEVELSWERRHLGLREWSRCCGKFCSLGMS
jgi:hypothetical protein